MGSVVYPKLVSSSVISYWFFGNLLKFLFTNFGVTARGCGHEKRIEVLEVGIGWGAWRRSHDRL